MAFSLEPEPQKIDYLIDQKSVFSQPDLKSEKVFQENADLVGDNTNEHIFALHAEFFTSIGDSSKPQNKESEPQGKKIDKSAVAGADGTSTWKVSKDKTWNLVDATGDPVEVRGLDPEKNKVTEALRLSDKSVKLTLDDGSILKNMPSGASIRFADEDAYKNGRGSDLFKSNGTHNKFKWDGDQLKVAELKQPFYQISKNIWATDPNARTGWHGKVEFDGTTGDISVTALSGADRDMTNLYRPTGRHEKHYPDGSVEFTFKAEGETVERTFKFKEGFGNDRDTLNQPEELTVKNEGGATYTWTRQKGDVYTQGGTKRRAKFSLSENEKGALKYTFEDLDSGERKEIENGRIFESEKKGELTEVKINGKLVEKSYGATRIHLDDKSEPKRIDQPELNRSWLPDSDGTWKSEALDGDLPYVVPDARLKSIAGHKDLTSEQKARMFDNVVKFSQEDYPQAEKDKFFASVDKLLEDNPKAKFNSKDRADLADQVLWHVVYEGRNDQGAHPSCSVTHLRGLLLYDEPSKMADLITQVATTGEFKAHDGTIIKPPIDSLKRLSGSEEASFPPTDGQRSWASKIWDVTSYNVHYQRQSKDRFTGQELKEGEKIVFEHHETKGSDSGFRMVKLDDKGNRWELYKEYQNRDIEKHEQIGMFMSQCLDIYHQITGKKLEGRSFAHQSRYVHGDDLFKKLGGTKVSSLSEFEDALRKIDQEDSWPVYLSLQTAEIHQNYKQQELLNKGQSYDHVAATGGGYHILLLNDLDTDTNTVGVDNSWGTKKDIPSIAQLKEMGIDPATRVPFTTADLFTAMGTKTIDTETRKFKGWYWSKKN